MIRFFQSRRAAPFLYPGEEFRPSTTRKLRLTGVAHYALEMGRIRLIVTGGLFVLAFALISARLVDLMIIDNKASATPSLASGGSDFHDRADILDRSGTILATNLPTANLYADSTEIIDANSSAARLKLVLKDLNQASVREKLSSGQRFIYISRHLTPKEQIAVNSLGVPGFHFEATKRRIYPHGSLFGHVLGVTDTDNQGKAGIEQYFDHRLKTHNHPLVTTLDVRIQYAVRTALQAALGTHHARAGAAVVTNARNGEILALVSLPDFDPRDIGTASKEARFNRATLGLYEMGSTFKLFTAAMALDKEIVNLTSKYDATQPFKVANYTIDDFRGQKRWLSIPEILVYSSNIGAARMGLAVGGDVQREFLQQLGLLSAIDLELPEVGWPSYPVPWRDIHTVTISYGHGIAVTPVHVAAAVSTLVNGGIAVNPTFVKIPEQSNFKEKRVISDNTSKQIRALMRLVVREGSGKQAEVPGYRVGGKTGSAEKISVRGGYSENRLLTSFVAAFPITDPEYVVLVVLDEPKGTLATHNFATAGWNAAPTAGQIISEIAPMLGVFPDPGADPSPTLASMLDVTEANAELITPDFTHTFGGRGAFE